MLSTGMILTGRTRDTIVANNLKLALSETPPEDDSPFQDQGFTRPRVLIILPTRNACLKVVNLLIAISGTTQQENKARSQRDYSLDEPDSIPASKPADFKDRFEGNDDDLFRIGIKFTRKSMKLFVEFYNADIILASPLGLKRVLESGTKRRDAKDGDEPPKKKPKGKGDYDFLLSIDYLSSTPSRISISKIGSISPTSWLTLISHLPPPHQNVTSPESNHTSSTMKQNIIVRQY